MVTIHGYTIVICNQSLGPTQPPTPDGMGNEYGPVAVLCNRRSGIIPAMHRRLWAQWSRKGRWAYHHSFTLVLLFAVISNVLLVLIQYGRCNHRTCCFSWCLFVCSCQYAMLEHYYKNKLSILCRPVDEACTRATQLSSNQLADVRSCDSFQRY